MTFDPSIPVASASPDPFTPEQRLRFERWQAELVRVFGNFISGSTWAGRRHIGFRDGRERLDRVAPYTEVGFTECVAFLRSIEHTVTPTPGPDFAKIRASKRRRR